MTSLPDVKVLEYLGRHVQPAPDGFGVHVRVNLRAPEFMEMTFLAIHGGGEWFIFAVRTEEDADLILRKGHPDMNKGDPFLRHPRFVEASVVGGTRTWRRGER